MISPRDGAGRLNKATILLADDDLAFRQALQSYLQTEFTIVGSVGDGQALLEAANRLRPDVIIADVVLPIVDGLHAARRIKATHPEARIIFLSVYEEPAFVAEAEKSGALGYVLKRNASSDLIPVIHRVFDGDHFVSDAA
jgi:DNA-binding NarL/FixJ family response regulator